MSANKPPTFSRSTPVQVLLHEREPIPTGHPDVWEVPGRDPVNIYRVIVLWGPPLRVICSCTAGQYSAPCWHGLLVLGRLVTGGKSVSEEAEAPPKRRRSTRGKDEEPAEAPPDRPIKPMAEAPPDRPIKPMVTKINAIAKRTVRTGQYESFEISTMVEMEPDRAYSTRENVRAANGLVTDEVNRMAEEISKQFESN